MKEALRDVELEITSEACCNKSLQNRSKLSKVFTTRLFPSYCTASTKFEICAFLGELIALLSGSWRDVVLLFSYVLYIFQKNFGNYVRTCEVTYFTAFFHASGTVRITLYMDQIAAELFWA